MGKSWQRGIVVGMDGSEQSLAAMDWAVLAADRHGTRLTVLSAYAALPVAAAALDTSIADLRSEACNAVEHAVARLGRARPGGHTVEQQIVHGDPAYMLAQRSRTADLVVVGSRGLGALDRVVLGSVSGTLAATAEGPVAVIPTATGSGDPGRVVVGISTENAGPQLDLGFAEAQQRACPLVAVHVMETDPAAAPDFGGPNARHDVDERDQVQRQVARWAEKYPSVTRHVVFRSGNAPDALLDELEPDDLAVLGGHAHPLTMGRLRYSITDAIVRRAHNPVIVAHQQE
ncbi:universal stress protein [Promicromonospora sukumoe]|uniref:Nucleotide-binding universal stress UspA family protein n=1 Tax=Promicromonospora sukumoe TaxID=88382 RepID=A0A7W3PD90_9MICO|nr:universal stress protein [Promicromonospora sukumoe]MBA8807720.1 nucleotide-binding universal stress UspA family protein [Promicromonospora sukumoe]